MARTNWQDPKTSEIRSTHISGLQEAVGKLEESVGIETVSETGIPLIEVYISSDDRYRMFQAPEGKRNWLLSPAPVIKKNGVVITDDFEIDYGGGAVIFTTPISESDILTADATYTKKTDIQAAIDEVYADLTSHKALYDKNNDGIVDVAETVIGNEIQLGSYKLVYNSTTNSLDIEVIA